MKRMNRLDVVRVVLLGIASLVLFTGCRKEPAEKDKTMGNPEEREIIEYTDEERALLDDANAMIEKKDVSVMMSRIYEDEDYSDFGRSVDKEYLEGILKESVESIELFRIDPPEEEVTSYGGEVYRWTLPLKWRLSFNHTEGSGGMNISHGVHLSEQKGRLVIIRQIPFSK